MSGAFGFTKWSLWLVALCCAVSVGCAGYQLGTRTLYRNDVQTIYLPVIKSESFRPELGVQLTEILQKEIERRTPYKLSDSPTADSVLTCRLISDTKRVVGELQTDEPRLLQAIASIEMKWEDRRGIPLIETRFLPPGEITFYFSETSDFVPEAGQSIATSYQRTLERLANHIVDQMETRW
jgi:hypothetical protein